MPPSGEASSDMEREVAISGGQIHAQHGDVNDKSFALAARAPAIISTIR
jgi:hypothetical protein